MLEPLVFADILLDRGKLPDETAAMTFIYLHKYRAYFHGKALIDPLDIYTTILACISLASKATEHPIILEGNIAMADFLLSCNEFPNPLGELYRLGNTPGDDLVPESRMKIPSDRYDATHSTLVTAELLLLRILGFNLRLVSPFNYLPQYLDRALQGLWEYCQYYDHPSESRRAGREAAAGRMLASRVGLDVRAKVVEACRNMRREVTVPANVVALGCIWVVLEKRGLLYGQVEREDWVYGVSIREVAIGDFVEKLKVDGAKNSN